MKFKFNYHKAKKYDLEKTNGLIENYNKKYPVPKYLHFIKHMLENGYEIRVVEVDHRSIGVDTLQDYERVKRLIEENPT